VGLLTWTGDVKPSALMWLEYDDELVIKLSFDLFWIIILLFPLMFCHRFFAKLCCFIISFVEEVVRG
jgi:hypothetical protein